MLLQIQEKNRQIEELEKQNKAYAMKENCFEEILSIITRHWDLVRFFFFFFYSSLNSLYSLLPCFLLKLH
jgi:hypothetical protein